MQAHSLKVDSIFQRKQRREPTMSVIRCKVLYLMSIVLLKSGINGQVTAPPSTAAALGDDVSLECTTAQDNPTFIWADGDDGVVIYFGDSRATADMEHTNVELGTSSNPQISILNINAIEMNDEGNYTCYLQGQSVNDATETMVTVEVGSSSLPIALTSNDTHYQATCEALESKPAETITWSLAGVEQSDGIEVTTLDATPPLSSRRSTFTFQATRDNYNDELRCVIGGHQVTSLNREESRRVDVHNPPETQGIIIQLNSDRTSLTVSCNINPDVDPAIPAMDMFYIYENGTLISKPLSDSTVTVTEPEQDTEYMCVGGNYLGNTTSTRTYQPGRITITPMTEPILTEETTSEPSEEPNLPEESTSEPRSQEPNPYTCDGLSSGASAGIAVLAILLVGSVIINVIQFIVWRRHSKRSEKNGSQKGPSSEVRVGSNEANDNMAYEMIQSGDRAYTALKLSSSGTSRSATIDPENVTFFTRLGSIGRGDFGAVWKGELRSHQGRAAVAIRQIPDHVPKSTDVLQSVTVLCGLPDQPNVVRCLGFCQEQRSIIYEFIFGGTLLTHLQTAGVQSQSTYSNLKPNRVRIDEDSLLKFAWQIAKGMQFLASKKIIHGTLCAHNVLLGDRKQCKLSDYGLASSLFSNKGKPTRWSSPEMMVTCIHSAEGDIWSFGIVLWEIVTLGARPYPNMTFDTVQKEVSEGYKMPRPQHCGHELYAIMNRCWETEGRNRISFDEIPKTLEKILEKTHDYLSLNDLDRDLYASPQDV